MMAAPWGARVVYKSNGLTLVALVTDQGPTNATVRCEWDTPEGPKSAYMPASVLTIIAPPYSHLPPPRKTA